MPMGNLQTAFQTMEEIIHTAKARGGNLTDVERREYDAAEKEYDFIMANEPETRAEYQRNLANAGGGRRTQPDDVFLNSGRTSALKAARSPKYRDMFGLASLSKGGFGTSEDFFQAVHGAGKHHNPKLQALAHTEGVATEGGFMVPEQFSAEMLDASLESEIVRPRAMNYPMTSNQRKIAGFDGADHASGTMFGGFTARWKPEANAGSEETAKVRLIELIAKKLFLYSKISNELLQDGGSFGEMLGTALIQSIGWHLDDAFLNGSGAGRPLGVLNDPAKITVGKEIGQTAVTINYTNLTKMFARMYASGLANAVWVCNPTCIPQLLALSQSVGTGGSHIPVMTESGGKFYILTREVLFTEKLPTLGTEGDIIFADFSQYAIGMRKDVSVEQSTHVGFSTDEVAYRAILRADGQGKWNKVLTPKNGDTQSWIVALATRA